MAKCVSGQAEQTTTPFPKFALKTKNNS